MVSFCRIRCILVPRKQRTREVLCRLLCRSTMSMMFQLNLLRGPQNTGNMQWQPYGRLLLGWVSTCTNGVHHYALSGWCATPTRKGIHIIKQGGVRAAPWSQIRSRFVFLPEDVTTDRPLMHCWLMEAHLCGGPPDRWGVDAVLELDSGDEVCSVGWKAPRSANEREAPEDNTRTSHHAGQSICC